MGINGYVQFLPFHLIQMTQTEFQTQLVTLGRGEIENK